MRRHSGPYLASLMGLILTGCANNGDVAFLEDAWGRYRSLYVHADGYVLDRRRDDGTVTSEGQGYALLRAVWEEDASTFARVFAWTERELRRADGLYSWHWSPSRGLLDVNSATDGDMEIAWALAMAAARFEEAGYRRRAEDLVRAVRVSTGVPIGDAWFPTAGNWAVEGRIVNLSYFVPYAHGWFDDLDPEGDWAGVAELGYELIARGLEPEDRSLLPTFLRVDEEGGVLPLEGAHELSEDFSFDGVRTFWRVEADCVLTGRAQACSDPLGVADVASKLAVDGRIVTRYTLDATPQTEEESLSFYAALLPAFRRHAPELAESVLVPKLEADRLRTLLGANDRYYDHNWVWFGLALAQGRISRASTPVPTRD